MMLEYTSAALEVAYKAGKMLREGQFSDLRTQYKSEIDLVTAMDRASEEMILAFLLERFPDHRIVAEEGSGSEGASGFAWYVDPLDGTVNYAHGLPWYSVSLALYLDGKPLCGVIHNPANGETFYAERGGGAYLDDRRIYVSSPENLVDCLMATGFPYYVHERPERVTRNLDKLLVKAQGIRRFGSAALDLAYVAAGRYDGYWEEGLHPWDFAAGLLIVQEAGGIVTNYGNNSITLEDNTIVAANETIHRKLIDLLEV